MSYRHKKHLKRGFSVPTQVRKNVRFVDEKIEDKKLETPITQVQKSLQTDNDIPQTVTVHVDESLIVVDKIDIVNIESNQDDKLEKNNEKLVNCDEISLVVYTCISGNYDKLSEVKNPSPCVKYVCFTDQNIKSKTWEIRNIPDFIKSQSDVRKARFIKLHPDIFFENFEISIWVDGNIEILGDVVKFVKENLTSNFCICKHPDRNCFYQEAKAVKSLRKDSDDVVNTQVRRYKRSKYPEMYGMVQTGILLRKHNESYVKEIHKNWWYEIQTNSYRDQLSFNFSIWGKNYDISIMEPSIFYSEYFELYSHTSKGSSKRKPPNSYFNPIVNFLNGEEV